MNRSRYTTAWLFTIVVALCPFRITAQESVVLPAPSGPYAVGRTKYDWVDESRRETLGSEAGRREIVVFVWYPAAAAPGATKAAWLPPCWADQLLAYELKTTPELLSAQQKESIEAVHTNAVVDAPPLRDRTKFPLLLFAPGYNQLPTSYSQLIEDIVSHGYVVAAIVPTDFAPVTMLSGHRVVMRSDQIKHATAETFEKVLPIWTADMLFAFTRLASTDPRGPLHGVIDFGKIGAFGHSFGGATAFEAALVEPRIKAAINLDGDMFGAVARNGLPKPIAIFEDERNLEHRNNPESLSDHERQRLATYDLVLRHGKPGYRFTIRGARHMSFSDEGMLPFVPQAEKASLGTIAPARALRIAEKYVEAFFDRYLKDLDVPVLRGTSREYPELICKKFNG